MFTRELNVTKMNGVKSRRFLATREGVKCEYHEGWAASEKPRSFSGIACAEAVGGGRYIRRLDSPWAGLVATIADDECGGRRFVRLVSVTNGRRSQKNIAPWRATDGNSRSTGRDNEAFKNVGREGGAIP